MFSAALYVILSQSMASEIDNTLNNRASLVQESLVTYMLQNPLTEALYGRVVVPRLDPFASSGIYVQVLDRYGRVVDRSQNLADRVLPYNENMFVTGLRGVEQKDTISQDGTPLRLLTTPLRFQNQTIGLVQVATSMREVQTAQRSMVIILSLGILVALVIAWVIGSFLAWQALKPVDRITQAARGIARAEDLSRRLAQHGPADEVGRLAATFNEMLERLESAFRTQQRFMADVSHELRTPLTTIRGNVDLLRRLKQVDYECLDAIDSEAKRMSSLVADLLLLAQADSGIQPIYKPVEVDTVLLEVYRHANTLGRMNNVRVVLGAEDQAVVNGDADRLKQLLLNLSDNAIKYTAVGGQVTLSLEREMGWVRVSIADTGIGIPQEDLPHIFDRFYRVDKARSREQGGTGLGLSIARWIADVHKGHITVTSKLGEGSTFTVWLPEYQPVQALPEPAAGALEPEVAAGPRFAGS
ncbi:MAG: HAMP domain-containing histidine kinase [Chloroflexi bacterium]|nr:HAMP domain-containing histidine kinase [Chloroflexota bacterium]